MNKTRYVIIALLLLMFAACDTTPQKPPAPAKPAAPEYLTGRTAFQKLLISARGFAGDTRPYRLQSIYTPGAPVVKGQAGIWSCGFASSSRRQQKTYTWSGVTAENAPERGISDNTEDTYSLSNTNTLIWELPFLKIDSDQAFAVAQKEGGDKLTAKDPDQPVKFVLDWDRQKGQLIWHVIYGANPIDAKLRIAVDASTGQYVRTEH